MTQFALIHIEGSSAHEALSSIENNNFLSSIARGFVDKEKLAKVFTIDIDSMMLEAQKEISSKGFQYTELYLLLDKLLEESCEIFLWYGSDYNDLDYVKDKSTFFQNLELALSAPSCEAYIHCKIPKTG